MPYGLAFLATFDCRHEGTVLLIRQEMAGHTLEMRTIVPRDFPGTLEKDSLYGRASWVQFENDGPFPVDVLEKLEHNIEAMEKAFDAMIEGTKAAKL